MATTGKVFFVEYRSERKKKMVFSLGGPSSCVVLLGTTVVSAITPHSTAAQRFDDDRETRQDMTKTCHVNLLRDASKCTIESAST